MNTVDHVTYDLNRYEQSFIEVSEAQEKSAIIEMIESFLTDKKYQHAELLIELIEEDIQKNMQFLNEEQVINMAKLTVRMNEIKNIYDAIADNDLVQSIAMQNMARDQDD